MFFDCDAPPPLLIELYQVIYELFYHVDSTFIIYILLIMTLLILSGLVSGSEISLFKLSPEILNKYNESNYAKERLIFKILENPKKLLATVLILNNLINVGIVILSTALLTHIFGEQNASDAFYLTVLTIINTIVIVILGEFLPKDFAYHNPEKFSKFTIFPISAFIKLFSPLSNILMRFTNIIESRIKKREDISLKEEDLEHVLNVTIDEDTPHHQRTILEGIVSLSSIPVKQIMKSRPDIRAIEYKCEFNILIKSIKEFGFSRIPIYKDSLDKIVGILYAKDLLNHIHENDNFEWQKKIKDVYFTPENKKIDDLLKTFQEKRVHMALVINEYGGISGLITLEDILEEIIGEIHDEFDVHQSPSYKKSGQKKYIFEAKTALADFCKIVNLPIETFEEEKGDNESIAGLLLEINKKMPKINDIILFNNVKFTILEANSWVIKSVEIELL